jgi:hypothetical protein
MRFLKIRLCDSGTGIDVSSATESQSRSASSKRFLWGRWKISGANATVAMQENMVRLKAEASEV